MKSEYRDKVFTKSFSLVFAHRGLRILKDTQASYLTSESLHISRWTSKSIGFLQHWESSFKNVCLLLPRCVSCAPVNCEELYTVLEKWFGNRILASTIVLFFNRVTQSLCEHLVSSHHQLRWQGGVTNMCLLLFYVLSVVFHFCHLTWSGSIDV